MPNHVSRSSRAPRAFAPHDPRSAAVRLALALVFGGLTALILSSWSQPWAICAVGGWDVTALSLLALSWWIIGRASPTETRRRAAAEDPGRTAVWAVVLASSLFSLFAATVALRQARTLPTEQGGLLIALCLMAVASAWGVTHTAYTLRYAHLHYRDAGGSGGLQFPGDDPPSDIDFAYFSFTVGMCFQVSDVSVSSRGLRRAVLGHSLLSFVYNTSIVALALNLVGGLIS